MKILVTGGAGFIASHVADNYIKNGHKVVIIDDLSRGKLANINKKAKFYKINICSKKLENIFRNFKPDIINHHAAKINVRESVEFPIDYEKNNIIGLINILENAKKYKTKKIINISSGGVVYGNPKKMPPNEKYSFNPLSPYALTKANGEYWVKYYYQQYGVKYTNLRYANIYGPRQSTQGGAGVIAIFSQLMKKNIKPTIFGDGSIGRDYLFIEDVVKINKIVLTKGHNESYNAGTGKITTVNEIFNILKNILNFKQKPIYTKEKPGEVKINYLDCKKANKDLKWIPKYKISEGITKSIEYL